MQKPRGLTNDSQVSSRGNRRVCVCVSARSTTFRVLSSKALKRYLTRTPTPPEDRNATLLLVEPSATDAASLTRLLAEVAPRARVLVVARQTVGRVSHLLKGFKSRVAAAGLSIHHRGGNSPSTGLVALYVLMQMCRKVRARCDEYRLPAHVS